MDENAGLACPHCGAALGISPGSEPQELNCAACGTAVSIPAAQAEQPETDAGRDDELDGLRIRQLTGARRAAYRSRSYCVIVAVICAVAIVQLGWNGAMLLRATGWTLRPISYFLFAMLAAWGMVFFIRKARDFHREAKQSTLPEPTAPPDFSTLGDGSERWRNLEDVR